MVQLVFGAFDRRVGGYMLLSLVLFFLSPVLPSSESDEAPWRNILKYPVFSRFIDQLSHKGAALDVGVPSSCFADHAGIHDDIRVFLEGYTSSLRLFTTPRGFCQGATFCYLPYCAVSKVLLLVCGKDWTSVCNSMVRQYSHQVIILSDEFYLKDTGVHSYLLRKTMTRAIQQGTSYNMTFSGKHVYLTLGEETECLSCLPAAVLSGETLNTTRQIPLRGRQLRVYCLHPYICELPTFPVLVDALRHKGANVITFHISQGSVNMQHVAEAFFIASESVVAYNPITELRSAVRVPMVVVPVYYDSFAYSVFARRRIPLPKEVVILLPFTWQVWVSLLSMMTLCVLTLEFFSRTPLNQKVRSNFGRSSVVHTFAALLLQQSCRLPANIRNLIPAQLVVGLWALLAVVVGTAFRGCLTSLLRQIPLEGSPLRFANERDILEQGYRFCRLTFQGDEINLDVARLTPVKSTHRICITEKNEVKYMNIARAVYLLHEPCVKKDESYIEQLYENDYAPLPQKLSPYLTGPSIRTSSRYRDAVKGVITQAFECGLFQRQHLLDDFIRNYKAAQVTRSRREIIYLTVGDLKGGLSFVACGLGLATLCFLLELGAKELNPIFSQRGQAQRKALLCVHRSYVHRSSPRPVRAVGSTPLGRALTFH